MFVQRVEVGVKVAATTVGTADMAHGYRAGAAVQLSLDIKRSPNLAQDQKAPWSASQHRPDTGSPGVKASPVKEMRFGGESAGIGLSHRLCAYRMHADKCHWIFVLCTQFSRWLCTKGPQSAYNAELVQHLCWTSISLGAILACCPHLGEMPHP
jgi:hypothetical protein